MRTLKETRRLRLLELIKEAGGQAELVNRLNKDRRQVSAWKTAGKGISDETAREIERVCRKPLGWMDGDSSGSAVTQKSGVVSDIGALSHLATPDPDIVAEAERWVRFEEGAGRSYTAPERARRFAELYALVVADGGRLSPEHCEQIINAARERPK